MLTPRHTGIPLRPHGQGDADPAGAGDAPSDGLLLVAHGSQCPAGVAEARALGDAVAGAHHDLAVELGFLELADPPAAAMLDRLVGRGSTRVTVQPLMLLAAGHGKSDVPAIVLEGRDRHPGIDLRLGAPLGVVPELLAVAHANLEDAAADGLPLLVVARGTSDPDANAEACRAARLLAEWSRAPAVDIGFTGVTWPSVPDALQRAAQLGHDRIGVFFWFLATGKLVERARDQMTDFRARSGIEVVDAGYFGPDPDLVPVIAQRHREALDGVHRTNCDTCTYRAAWPGREDRVGQPRGVGHSHLAAQHRHGHAPAHAD
ncbi:MAG TPA: sirohydrochlorin chelatase [Acidimicrobiales bacterium]|nr:sirohydrochlorin chelatase [Acidimicrobiales bacterium]